MTVCRPRPPDPATVQGNVLKGYRFDHVAHAVLRIDDPARARRWLADTAHLVTSGAPWADKPDRTWNVAFSHRGLVALGLPEAVLGSFSREHRDGMLARAAMLGDIGDSAPDRWDAPYREPDRLHVLVSRYATADAIGDAEAELRASLDDAGLELVVVEHGARLPKDREHFGYLDGVGQPTFAGGGPGARTEGNPGPGGRFHRVAVGELLHGHRNESGAVGDAPAPPYGPNGSYLVFRKLAQHVGRFRRFVAEQATALALEPDLVMAKLVGRWPDGTPLAVSPDRPDPAVVADPVRIDDFTYADDPLGLRCPLGAHIRRVNPRDGLAGDAALVGQHRIVRRGMPYGPPLAEGALDDDGAERGLLFTGLVTDLDAQFEFIVQEWCLRGDRVLVGKDPDPMIGHGAGTAKLTIGGAPPRFLHPLPDVVTTRGGEYFWLPSMAALSHLTRG